MKKLAIVVCALGVLSCQRGLEQTTEQATVDTTAIVVAEEVSSEEERLLSEVREYAGGTFRCVTASAEDVRMAWKDTAGNVVGMVNPLRQIVEERGETLLFAMNGGMYMEDRTPCGLYVENGEKQHGLSKKLSGKGNYTMAYNGVLTNGVFVVMGDSAKVMRSVDYTDDADVRYATQSGPMLVYDGVINQAFGVESPNVLIRNGVGVDEEGRAVFVRSETPTNLYTLAEFFRDEMHCPSAFYLDGSVSEMYVRGEREDAWMHDVGVLIYIAK